MENEANTIIGVENAELLSNIKKLIQNARRRLAISVNLVMIETYWEIGRLIVEEEQKGLERAKYGDSIVDNVSRELKIEFGKGFSRSNVFSMKKFYLKYQKVQTLSGQLSWSHYLHLLLIKDDDERNFYEKECANSNWSVRELKRQIDSALYYRLLICRDKKDKDEIMHLAEKGITYSKPIDVLKDPIVFDFIGETEPKPRLESDLQSALLNHLKEFLLELGRGFMFVSTQYRISMTGKNYYVDLVLYNKILRCYVLIDLKMGDFEPENLGQMNFYVNYFKKEINDDGDNEPIGIILCADKDNVVVECSMDGIRNNIYPAKYTFVIPSKEELEQELNRYIK